MDSYYKCKPSIRVKLISLLSFILMFIMAIRVSVYPHDLISIIVLFFIAAILIITFIHSPHKICVTNKSIVLHCFLSKKIFYYNNIESISRIYGIGGIRRFGSNGVLGYIGILDGEELYYTYFNHERNMIEIIYKSKHYIISCTNADDLISKVKANLYSCN